MSFVLVIDDDADSRVILATLLTSKGYRVVTATNGREGLRLARKHRPGVILLDLAMPEMDGFAFRAEQLHDDRIKDIPVVCITGMDEPELKARRVGAVACLEKPFRYDDVSRVVAAYATN